MNKYTNEEARAKPNVYENNIFPVLWWISTKIFINRYVIKKLSKLVE
jgi:hypothetical protein